MSSLEYARAELERRHRSLSLEPLDAIYRKLHPDWYVADHLKTLDSAFQRAEDGEQVKVAVSLPPRFGKTELVLHRLARWLMVRRSDRIMYTSYSSRISKSKSRRLQSYCRKLGIRLESTSVIDWSTTDGGGVLASGVGGELTGHGGSIVVIDDPHKNREEAESVTMRERVWDWYTSTVRTRLEPTGSIIIVHTRWHPDDLIGRLAAKGEIEIINMPALDDQERSLWSERWPSSQLCKIREEIGEYDWASLYQGKPIPAGGALMKQPVFYDVLPRGCELFGVGLDLAYSSKTKGDSSCAVVIATHAGRYYIVDVVAAEIGPEEFAKVLKSLQDRYHVNTVPRIDGAATERPTIDLFRQFGVSINFVIATRDKFLRAQRLAALWNAGLVMVPRNVPWSNKYLQVMQGFTGCGDKHDDEVDATVSALNAVTVTSAEYVSPEILRRLR